MTTSKRPFQTSVPFVVSQCSDILQGKRDVRCADIFNKSETLSTFRGYKKIMETFDGMLVAMYVEM